MTLQEVFYLTISIAAIVTTIAVVYVTFVVVTTLKTAQKSLEGLKDAGQSLNMIKEGLRFGAFKFASNILSKFKGGDEKNG